MVELSLTEMDAIVYIDEMLSSRALVLFIKENVPGDKESLFSISREVKELHKFMKCRKFMAIPEEEKKALIENVQLAASKVGNLMNGILGHGSKKQSSSSGNQDLVKDWVETRELIAGIVKTSKKLNQTKLEGEVTLEDIYAGLNVVNKVPDMVIYTGDRFTFNPDLETLNEEERLALFLIKVFPELGELKESPKIHNFLFELSNELVNLPRLIFNTFPAESSLALFLIGGLLSLKPIDYDTWNKVKDDLVKIKGSNNCVTSNDMRHIITYCYGDLPYFLKLCFLYIAHYPILIHYLFHYRIRYPIRATSVTEIWMAEGFVTPKEGETIEETAEKYLEQLVQRSLVLVYGRSVLGTIKTCWVHDSVSEFAVQQSYIDGFLVVNPAHEEIENVFRLAIHFDTEKQYNEVNSNRIRSLLGFACDINFLGAEHLRVLELSHSIISFASSPNMIKLRYLGLRHSQLDELPKNIGDMENLETLDVRDTKIETLPESLWNISALRHVYVNPSRHIKGPSSAAKLSDLQVLKTVVAHESWAKNIPQFLIHLRKFGFSHWDNLEYESSSNLLSHMDELISMKITGNPLPSEFVDIRAFPNLKTVKAIKVEGEWISRRLPIDNIKFSPNLAKLTLINSKLKEDPMPPLEKLQALKYLILKNNAYTGKQMVCTENGFPLLQLLYIVKMEDFEDLEVKPMGMSQLTTLLVYQCLKFNKNLRNLDHVPDIDIID